MIAANLGFSVTNTPTALTGTTVDVSTVYPLTNADKVPEVYGIAARSYTFSGGITRLNGLYTHDQAFPYEN